MLPPGKHKSMVARVTEFLHLGRKFEAASIFAKFCGVKLDDTNAAWDQMLLTLYHWLLNHGAMEEAATLLWSPRVFNPKPQATREVWQLFDDSNQGLIMGAASMSKSYTMGVRLFLEWTRDPEYTTVNVLGPSAGHLERNLFSHLVRLHKNASLPMPGKIGDMFIGLDRRDLATAISGVVIPIGNNKKAGRLQGAKRFQRKKPHPLFGNMSRLFIFLDEIENIPAGIWSDIDNLMSGVGEGKESIKIFGAYNPTDSSNIVREKAEPAFGWDNLDPDVHFRWKSVRGWDVLRLDAHQSENYKAGKTIFEGLQTKAGVDRIARNSGGVESPGYLSMVRAMYPRTGSTLVIFQPAVLGKLKAELIWADPPTPIGSVDLALEGKASAIFTYGQFGRAVGQTVPPTLDFPNGRKEMFRDKHGRSVPRYALQAMTQFSLPKGATEEMYRSIVDASMKLKIKPEHLCVDRTGNGAGVHDLLRSRWNLSVIGVNYSEGATERKIMAEDLLTPKEEFERITTELWFAAQRWAEFGFLRTHPTMDTFELFDQLGARRYLVSGKKTKVESKADYISRGRASPDEADSFTLLVHAARVSHDITLSMNHDRAYAPESEDDDDGWNPQRIDPTNRFDSLEFA